MYLSNDETGSWKKCPGNQAIPFECNERVAPCQHITTSEENNDGSAPVSKAETNWNSKSLKSSQTTLWVALNRVPCIFWRPLKRPKSVLNSIWPTQVKTSLKREENRRLRSMIYVWCRPVIIQFPSHKDVDRSSPKNKKFESEMIVVTSQMVESTAKLADNTHEPAARHMG